MILHQTSQASIENLVLILHLFLLRLFHIQKALSGDRIKVWIEYESGMGSLIVYFLWFYSSIVIAILKQCGNGTHDHELSWGNKIRVTESITAISIVKNAFLADFGIELDSKLGDINRCFCLLFLTCLPSDFSFSLPVLHSKPEIILSSSTFVVDAGKPLQNLPVKIVRIAKHWKHEFS